MRATALGVDELNDYAQRLIETALASDRNALLPVRVSDIQERVPGAAGPILGMLLQHARTLFLQGVVDRNAILDGCLSEFEASQNL